MADPLEKIVDPDGSGDYNTLNDWEAGEQGYDYITNDKYALATCRCTGGTADDEACVIDGWSYINSTHWIQIWTNPSEAYRHDGTYLTGNHYRMESNDVKFNVVEDYVKIIGIQTKMTSSNSWENEFYIDSPTDGAWVYIEQCLMWAAFGGGSDNDYCIRCAYEGSGTRDLYVSNCIIYDYENGSSTNMWAVYGNGGWDEYVYATTVYNCVHGFSYLNKVRNCIYDSNGLGSADGYLSISDEDYNISDLASDTSGSHSYNETTVTFKAEGSDDFRLDSSDTAAKDKGATLSGDSDYPMPAVDIENQSRTGTWDIGASEIVAAAAAVFHGLPLLGAGK